MSDNELNTQQQHLAAARRQVRRSRPPGVDPKDWKERNKVWAKLTDHNYHLFFIWAKKNNLNINSGINRLIASHPEINPEYKNHA